jgi:chromosome segregation protein
VSGNAERAAADLVKLASETDELERENLRVAGLREGAQRRQEQADALVAHFTARREIALARAGESRQAAETLGREADAAQSERDSLAGRLSSLEEIVATHAAFDEGVRALLAGPNGIEVLGVVADAVETDSQFERAVEALFGDRLQAVMVPDASHALRGIAWLEESGAGRGTFLPLASARTRQECATLRDVARVEPGARGLIADLFRVSGPHADAIRGSLPDALVVETLEQALEIVSRRGPVSCVTLAGETLRGSMIEGGRAVKGLLAPRREIKEVQARLQVLEEALAGLRQRAQDHAAAADAANAEARVLEEQIHGADMELVAIRHDLAVAQDERARLVRKAAVLDTERLQAEDERSEAAVRLAEIEQGLRSAERDRESGSERVTTAAAAVAEARAAAESAQARFSEARSLHAALGERMLAIEAECQRAARDHQELQSRGAAARTRAGEMDERRRELLAERQNVERLLAEALAERDRVAGEAAVAEDRVRDIRNELEGREAGLKERRREREMLREALTELEVTQARTGADLDHLGRECHQAVGIMAAEAAALLSAEDEAQDVSGLEAQIQEMRERLDRMGPVNILAVEQSQELEERHTFLTAQRQDLLDSIAELDQAIKRIDRTSKERFREAFGVIDQHFGDIFRQLFGGGSAGLTLLDEDDILESGIDVMAQPPGKRLQSVMLLSGGEKALTAIALLFAIFQYKPSPFCILDEVDAPLDDANIGRFVRMLDGLKEQTQFVLITHSRKTMEIADQLYGVTMEEPGVSKLVSVRFS